MPAKLGTSRKAVTAGGKTHTCLRTLIHQLSIDLEEINGSKWPCTKWQTNPIGFIREVLKEEPLSHQVEILEAVLNNTKIAVRSGQKTGKTKLLIWLSIWFYCSFEDAKVIMTAAIKDQIDKVLWNEMTRTLFKAKQKGLTIESPGATANSGLRSLDGRMVYGFTARDIESVGGISSPNMLFLVDEASALTQQFAEAIEGNMAGGNCHLLYISNPTRTSGPFFDAFHSKANYWKTFHLSSEAVAQYLDANGISVRGVASLETIERWALEWKRESVFFRMRVLGDFILSESGKILSVQCITDAQIRWNDLIDDGLLSIGVDPAGHAVGGDEYAFSIVRGVKHIGIHTFAGLSEDQAIAHLKAFLLTYRRGDEIPQVIIDSEGPIGGSLLFRLQAMAEFLRINKVDESFEVFGVKASVPARRAPHLYDKARDELWANLAEWMETGGIISDNKLEAELNTPMWEPISNGKAKVTAKDEFRKLLNRSPDRADSLALAVWQPRTWMTGKKRVDLPPVMESTLPQKINGFDPYDTSLIDEGGGFDPYKR